MFALCVFFNAKSEKKKKKNQFLQDLLAAVEKMNSSLSEKANNYFHQDEIASLDLGTYIFIAILVFFII